jgi:hypothetical protein
VGETRWVDARLDHPPFFCPLPVEESNDGLENWIIAVVVNDDLHLVYAFATLTKVIAVLLADGPHAASGCASDISDAPSQAERGHR